MKNNLSLSYNDLIKIEEAIKTDSFERGTSYENSSYYRKIRNAIEWYNPFYYYEEYIDDIDVCLEKWFNLYIIKRRIRKSTAKSILEKMDINKFYYKDYINHNYKGDLEYESKYTSSPKISLVSNIDQILSPGPKYERDKTFYDHVYIYQSGTEFAIYGIESNYVNDEKNRLVFSSFGNCLLAVTEKYISKKEDSRGYVEEFFSEGKIIDEWTEKHLVCKQLLAKEKRLKKEINDWNNKKQTTLKERIVNLAMNLIGKGL
jgi:hypothetical protein